MPALLGVAVGAANGFAEWFPFWVYVIVVLIGAVMVALAKRKAAKGERPTPG